MAKRNNSVMVAKYCVFICFACVIMCAVLSLFITSSSADPVNGNITVVLNDKDKQPINDIAVKIYKIASISGTDYFPEESFAISEIDIADIVNDPSAERASSLFEYADAKGIEGITEQTSEGRALFSSLDKGIWLVSCMKGQPYTFAPFFIFLPNTLNGENGMDIVSTPKTQEDEPDNRIISVTKIWNDGQNKAGKRPNSIFVTLKRNGIALFEAELSDLNGWTYFFEKLPDDGEYTVEEKNVDGYAAEYSGDAENGFVITNVYTGAPPPQTGSGYLVLTGGLAMISAIVLFVIMRIGKRRKI